MVWDIPFVSTIYSFVDPVNRAKGLVIGTYLADYIDQHPVAQKQTDTYEPVVNSICAKLEPLGTKLAATLPALPSPEDVAGNEALQGKAMRVGKRLLELLPTHLLTAATQTATEVSQEYTYEDVRANYDDLVNHAIPAYSYYKDALPAALTAFAVDQKITPAELKRFDENLKRLSVMLPYIAEVTDVVAKLDRLDSKLGVLTRMAVPTPVPVPLPAPVPA